MDVISIPKAPTSGPKLELGKPTQNLGPVSSVTKKIDLPPDPVKEKISYSKMFHEK